MDERVRQLKGGHLGDIDLTSQQNVNWKQSICPWNEEEGNDIHKCTIKYTSICKYFCGIKYLDTILCSYPYENIDVLKGDEIDRPMKKCLSCGRHIGAENYICGHCGYEEESKQ